IVRDDVTSLVIEDGTSTVVGIAAVGADRGEPGAAGELWLINLAPEAWGRGLGRRLLEAATDELRGQGFDEAVLWVLDANARARRFYGRAGWAPDGGAKARTWAGQRSARSATAVGSVRRRQPAVDDDGAGQAVVPASTVERPQDGQVDHGRPHE
ncbi:MAG: hypothetical protein QOJ09_1691, partial [Actinomycetota bacterium]|nr:hypothetical protein [Actinomycetota bacterium]